MKQVWMLIFAVLALMQPNAQSREATAWITLAQFGSLTAIALTRDRPRE